VSGWRVRTGLAASGIAVLLAAAALSACGASQPELRVAGNVEPAGIEEFDVGANEPWSFLTVLLCMNQEGSARIENVEFDEPTAGLRVDAFATAPNPYPSGGPLNGAGPVLLPNLNPGYVLGGEPITSVCPKPGEEASWTGGTMLAIQVSKDSDGFAFSQALNVTYESDGSQDVLWIPFGIALCDQPQATPCPLPPPPSLPGPD